MKPIHLIPLIDASGGAGLGRLELLGAGLSRAFQTACSVRPQTFDIEFAFDPRRGQYYSTAILQRLDRFSDSGARILGVTASDLYVPVLTFVFGEAQLNGNCAVVSIARLRDEYYGLPPRADVLADRLYKEAVHELGHTFGLRHCNGWQCVMSSSHAVERLDVKGAEFCQACGRKIRS